MQTGNDMRRLYSRHLILGALALIVAAGSPAVCRSAPGVPYSLGERHTVIDQAGRRIEVRRPFERIISLYGAHTENLFALGYEGGVIGVGRNEVYPPAALKKRPPAASAIMRVAARS